MFQIGGPVFHNVAHLCLPSAHLDAGVGRRVHGIQGSAVVWEDCRHPLRVILPTTNALPGERQRQPGGHSVGPGDNQVSTRRGGLGGCAVLGCLQEKLGNIDDLHLLFALDL